ncbi:hypothetical protein FRC15_001169 [Serendipita sp. 397]|nr:hypothetical protein FRC15_001169 [Serendipita sp. 397]
MSSTIVGEAYLPQEVQTHRLRHITSIQIRNFTPFPIRDVVTSSLAAVGPVPLEYQDDADLTLSRRRSRRISTNSLYTLRSLRGDGTRADDSATATSSQALDLSPGRPRANSRSIRKSIPTGFPQRPQRVRTTSSASMHSLAKPSLSMPYDSPSLKGSDAIPSSPVVPYVEIDEYQRSLERVVASRLVETFLCLEAWTEGSRTKSNSLRSKHSISPVRPIGISSEPLSTRLRSSSASSTPHGQNFQPITPQPSQREVSVQDKAKPSSSSSASKSRPSLPSTSGSSARYSPRINRNEPVRSNTVSTTHALPTPAPSPPPSDVGDGAIDCAPFYISHFHAPSTNPSFTSLEVNHDFAPWIDLGTRRFKASLWGNAASEWGKSHKPLENEEPPTSPEQKETWEVLTSWNVDMNELVPLTSDPLLLPSNTLVLQLAPNGDMFYLPTNKRRSLSNSGPTSPVAGYSDTEIDYEGSGPTNRGKDRTSHVLRSDILNKSLREVKMKKSAGFGDLLKLVTLQSAIADTKIQLDEIIDECDHLLADDLSACMFREISEREEALRNQKETLNALRLQTSQRRTELQAKRAYLRKRNERLERARELQSEDSTALNHTQDEVHELRGQHATLSTTLQAVRTTLLQTVANIFPIEPLEPRDLLFSILAVPLPIPTGTNDPAPPLTLPNNNSYNEDAMASAMGYVAQVVNLISAYLGELSVYPIRCLGSRSMIKDPISAMMGPRVFPLYARGVEPYRFEYGVFLLNKNIEMLMSERNLRAMDLRHTLPNLKNLLLTLTSGETVVLKPRARKKSSILPNPDATSIASSDPPTRTSSPLLSSELASESGSSIQIEHTLPTTPTASKVVIEPDPEQPTEDLTPTSSSLLPNTSTADKVDTPTVKKTFYSPLAALLRTRYPSVRTTSNPSSSALNLKVEAEVEPSSSSDPLAPQRGETAPKNDADETSTIRGRKATPLVVDDSIGSE